MYYKYFFPAQHNPVVEQLQQESLGEKEVHTITVTTHYYVGKSSD